MNMNTDHMNTRTAEIFLAMLAFNMLAMHSICYTTHVTAIEKRCGYGFGKLHCKVRCLK